jgi:cytochrome c oxidase subunit 2
VKPPCKPEDATERLIGKDINVKKTLLGISVASVVTALVVLASPGAQAQGTVREFTIRGDQFAFSPTRIEVQKDDIVKLTFTAVDIAHSFIVDEYRIAKRASAGQTVTFEFRAAGNARFYCNLTQDERCKGMHGEIVVK